jgi:transcriptional regulator with XRE-family HTH domain
LGRYLRKAREDAGITREAAARELEWSVQKLWRIENGATSLRAIDVRNMSELYRIDSELTEELMSLARETKAKGWWHAYGDAIPPFFELYVGLEAAAERIRNYEAELVPGLLQTEAYMHEVIQVSDSGMPEEDKEKRVAIKLERQHLLSRRLPPPPKLQVILNEAVLRRPTRDLRTMAGQLRHLIAVSQELPNVAVRVLPFSAGLHKAAGAGAFAILDFEARGAHPDPSTVYSEAPTGALYLDKPAEVATYEGIWTGVNELALGERQSYGLITSVAEEYES